MPRDNLKQWERSSGYKAREIAKMLDVSDSTWSNIKSGRKNPTFKLLVKFQKIFKPVDIITLFSEG